MGVPTFIASGDRVTKLERMADHLGIPRDRVYGVATPTVKAQIVSDLRQEYDRVLMVGDGINDLCAMRNADIAILTVQQPGDRPSGRKHRQPQQTDEPDSYAYFETPQMTLP